MRDWKAIAKARKLEIPAENLEQMSGSLDEMEEIFRSLISDLAAEIEPAYDLRLEEGE